MGKIIRDLIIGKKTEKKDFVDIAVNLSQSDVIIAHDVENVFW